MKIETSIGTIKVNNTLFAKLIYEAICLTNDELMLCDNDLKIIASKNKKVKTNQLANNIIVNVNDNIVYLSFNTIMSFGVSVNKNADIVLTYVLNNLISLFKGYSFNINLRVIGVKSKGVLRRDLEFNKSYEFK